MNIAVYCSANNCIPDEYLRLGDEVGEWLARNGHSLVYGGAIGGLMSRVSDAFRRTRDNNRVNEELRGQIIGVVPNRIILSGRKAENCDSLFVVGTMAERKQRMRDLADCFICLPGSYGTLDEMMDVASSAIVGEHQKPTCVLNYKGFYDPLRQQIERMRNLQFIPEQENYKPVFVNTIGELFEQITNLK